VHNVVIDQTPVRQSLYVHFWLLT